jgi:peptidoglycan-associated lipoprotein
MNQHRLAALFVFFSVAVAGCSSTPDAPVAPAAPAAPVAAAKVPDAAPRLAPQPVPAAPMASTTLPPHLDPKSAISMERNVYFDFDDFSIKSEYTGLIERQGRYLATQPALAIKLEGHADERGSSEYNLALGQRRAETVARALKIYGVKDAQMEAISWGEERPAAEGHSETAWAKNRRAEIVYPAK